MVAARARQYRERLRGEAMSDGSEILSLFGVRNSDGEWFCGRGEYRADVNTAVLYGSIGGARTIATREARSGYGTPDVVEFHVDRLTVHDQKKRIASIDRKLALASAARAAKNHALEVARVKWKLEDAERRLAVLKKAKP